MNGQHIEGGYVMIARKISESSMWQCLEPTHKIVALTCILLANHKPKKWLWGKKEIIIQRGQFVRSLENLASESGLGINKETVRRALKNLQRLDFLRVEPTHQGHLITVCNYGSYQDPTNYTQHTNDTRATQERHKSDTKQEVKEVKKLKDKTLVDSQKPESPGESKPSPPKKKSDPQSSTVQYLFDAWCIIFKHYHPYEYRANFGLDKKRLKELLGYVESNSLVPKDKKVLFLVGCMQLHWEVQKEREVKYKSKPTISGFCGDFDSILDKDIEWDELKNPEGWKELGREVAYVEKEKQD